MRPEAAESLAALAALHAAIDRRVAQLLPLHGPRLRCRVGCASCCVDGLTVFAVEAARIEAEHPELLAHGQPSAQGCAFLDQAGACRIYEARPYVCRTQGLPLRWLEGEAERRDICPLNEQGPPLEALPPEDCWVIGPVEARLQLLQRLAQGPEGELERRSLRGLFRRVAPC